MEPSRQFPGRTQHTTAVHFGQHLGWKQLESRVLVHKNSQWQWQAICCPAFACVAASKRQRWFLVAQSIRTYLAVSTVTTGNPSVDDTASESRFCQPRRHRIGSHSTERSPRYFFLPRSQNLRPPIWMLPAYIPISSLITPRRED